MQDWTPRQRIENSFRRELFRLVNQYINFPQDATMGEINRVLSKFHEVSATLEDYAFDMANRIIEQVDFSNSRSWRHAARRSARGRIIYNALKGSALQRNGGVIDYRRKELVEETADLISSLPSRLREHVADHIATLQLHGIRPEAVAKEIAHSFPHLTKSRCTLIARTQVSKSATALTRARSEDLSLDWYIWSTSEDGRVRPSHRIMDNVLIRWVDPPSPEILAREKSEGRYHAGEIFNCRCDAIPLTDVRQVRWPAKVYLGGAIRRMTLAGFQKQFRNPIRGELPE